MIALLYSAFLILTFAVSTKSLGCITKTLSSKKVNCLLILSKSACLINALVQSVLSLESVSKEY